MRFVAGTGYSSRAFARRILGKRALEMAGSIGDDAPAPARLDTAFVRR